MTEKGRLVHHVRKRTLDLTGERGCSWCFRMFPVEKLTPMKRGNGQKAYICPTCLSNKKPKKKKKP